jgi:hypothetical protein
MEFRHARDESEGEPADDEQDRIGDAQRVRGDEEPEPDGQQRAAICRAACAESVMRP